MKSDFKEKKTLRDVLVEIATNLKQLLSKESAPTLVNVPPSQVNVAAPEIHVEAPKVTFQLERKTRWNFDITARDTHGLIKTFTGVAAAELHDGASNAAPHPQKQTIRWRFDTTSRDAKGLIKSFTATPE